MTVVSINLILISLNYHEDFLSLRGEHGHLLRLTALIYLYGPLSFASYHNPMNYCPFVFVLISSGLQQEQI